MAFEIESGIAYPEHLGKRGKKPIYPFANMQVGDSFGYPKDRAATVRNAATNFGDRKGWKFCTATTGDQGRVWRIA